MPGGLPGAGGPARAVPGAGAALALLLGINLFNYIDRQILSAVLPRLQQDGTIIRPDDPNGQFKLGLLTSAFMVSYMVFAPLFGWLDGHGVRRWTILGLGVVVWSLASGSSGLAGGYAVLLATRCLIGIGEAAYGPVASAMLADLYPVERRGAVMAVFNMAIPVGSALGFVIGGVVAGAANDWRPAFYVTFSGIVLGVICFLMREPPRSGAVMGGGPSYPVAVKALARNRSFVLCCAGMTAVTFVLGGVAAWVPAYVFQREARFQLTADVVDQLAADLPPRVADRLRTAADGSVRTYSEMKTVLVERLGEDAGPHADAVYTAAVTADSPSVTGLNVTFGGIVVVGGLVATAFGAWLGERLRTRVRGAYFWVIGGGALFALPCYLALLYVPFPLAWVFVFLAVFGLFMHTGPAFTAIANVTGSNVRATAFALNILIIHALGDVISPTLIGFVADRSDLQTAFILMSGMILLGGLLWIVGARYLDNDTRRADEAEAAGRG